MIDSIPTSFRMAGNRWTVKMLRKNATEYGSCDAENHIIRINAQVNGEYVSTTVLLKTFLHEWWHAFEATTGREYSEQDAIRFEEMMFQTLESARGKQ